MCLAFFQLQALNTKPDRLAELLGQGRHHLECSCRLAGSQVERGGRVLFDNPWVATSWWNQPCLKKLFAIDGMRRVRCDQSQFGITSVDDAGNVGLARKVTGFMPNDECIAEALYRRCFGGHDHIQLLNGRNNVAAILRALRQSMRAAGCGEAQGLMGRDGQLTIATLEVGPTLEEPELLSLPDSMDSAQEFGDRSAGLPLNPEMVKRAIELEMQHMDELKVLEDSDRDTCIAETGRPPIPTGWVDIDKDRSRLVCQETRGRSTIDVEDRTSTFAANSLYEALRMQLSLMMTGPKSQVEGDDDVLMPLDTSRLTLARVVIVTINGTVYKLLKATYGLRGA